MKTLNLVKDMADILYSTKGVIQLITQEVPEKNEGDFISSSSETSPVVNPDLPTEGDIKEEVTDAEEKENAE